MDCEKLISYVFEHKILYDQSLPEYKDNDRKHNVGPMEDNCSEHGVWRYVWLVCKQIS